MLIGAILLGIGFFCVSNSISFSRGFGEDELSLQVENGQYYITNNAEIKVELDKSVFIKQKSIEYLAYLGFISGAICIWLFFARFMVYRVKHRDKFR